MDLLIFLWNVFNENIVLCPEDVYKNCHISFLYEIPLQNDKVISMNKRIYSPNKRLDFVVGLSPDHYY